MSEQEHIIKELAESEQTELTEGLFNALVASLREAFGLNDVKARKAVINTLRGLYAQ